MPVCTFEEEIKYPNGAYSHSKCINGADIRITNDPCFGLCYGCAYEKTKKENKRVQAELEKYKKALKDTPTNEDMDAAVFQVNMLKAELDKLKLESKIYELRANELKAKLRWIPVSERLPKLFDIPHPHSARVLIYLSPDISEMVGGVNIGWLEKDRGWRYGDGTREIFPTYWMPITPLDIA